MTVKDDCIFTIHTVVPAMRETPIYIESAKDIGLEAHPIVAAFTSVMLDLHIQPQLETFGLWRGRGFATIHCDELNLRSSPGLLLHELIHWDLSPAAWKLPAEELDESALAAAHPSNLTSPQTASAAYFGTKPSEDVAALVPWVRHHPATFGRAAIHAAHRANCGWSRVGHIDPERVWDAKGYGLSATESYVSAFWDEPQRLINMTLQQVVAEPVPAAVDALIYADTKRYLDDLMVWYESEMKERREAEGLPS